MVYRAYEIKCQIVIPQDPRISEDLVECIIAKGMEALEMTPQAIFNGDYSDMEAQW